MRAAALKKTQKRGDSSLTSEKERGYRLQRGTGHIRGIKLFAVLVARGIVPSQ